jgi:hypothetical protein
MTECLIRLGICGIDVPTPWLISPAHPISLNEAIANPTMCTQRPTTPLMLSNVQVAAALVGSVSSSPTNTFIMSDIQNGCVLDVLTQPRPREAKGMPDVQ